MRNSRNRSTWIGPLLALILLALPLSVAHANPVWPGPGLAAATHFFRGLVLTVIVESLALALLFKLRPDRNLAPITGAIKRLVLINLVTFPMVWVCFPSLGSGNTGASLALGMICLVWGLIYAVLLVKAYKARDRYQKELFLLPAVAILVTGYLYYLSIPATSHIVRPVTLLDILQLIGQSTTALYTISIWINSELFAVLAEGVLFFLLSRGSLGWRKSAGISLLLNGASFVAGLLILGPLAAAGPAAGGMQSRTP